MSIVITLVLVLSAYLTRGTKKLSDVLSVAALVCFVIILFT